MNIMIVGGGLLGRKTAETLDEAGHDVVLIDASPENLAQLSPDFSGSILVKSRPGQGSSFTVCLPDKNGQ